MVPNEGDIISVKYISRTNLTRLDTLIDLGFNPRDLSREELYRRDMCWDGSCV